MVVLTHRHKIIISIVFKGSNVLRTATECIIRRDSNHNGQIVSQMRLHRHRYAGIDGNLNYTLLLNADGLPQRCKAYRKLHKLSQQQLADILHIGKSAVWRIENNLAHQVLKETVSMVEKLIR